MSKNYLDEELVEVELRDWFTYKYDSDMHVLDIIRAIENILRNMKPENVTDKQELTNMHKKYFEADLVRKSISIAKQQAIVEDDVTYLQQLLEGKECDNLIDGQKLYNSIAGHSYYSGDKILTRIVCMQQGQEIDKNIEPESNKIKVPKQIYYKGTIYVIPDKCPECGADIIKSIE